MLDELYRVLKDDRVYLMASYIIFPVKILNINSDIPVPKPLSYPNKDHLINISIYCYYDIIFNIMI